MKSARHVVLTAAILMSVGVPPAEAQDDDWRHIEVETSEVTAPDVTVSPDGEWLIFMMLGHLFRLPVEGGDAEQLTFGPYYDAAPAISPDGRSVVFRSDRDASEGNLFLMDLASGEITQLTHEPDEKWTDRPTWSPDGQSVAFVRLVRNPEGGRDHQRRGLALADVRRVHRDGGEPEVLTAFGRIRTVFYLPDGRVGWTELEGEELSPDGHAPAEVTTRIEVMDEAGHVSTIRSIEGIVDRVVANAEGDALYVRRFVPLEVFSIVRRDDILVLPISGGGAERHILPVGGSWYGTPRFARDPVGPALYLGNAGHLWKITVPDGIRERIPFTARVAMQVRAPVTPAKPVFVAPGERAPVRLVSAPRLSEDGRLMFVAAGSLWLQPTDTGPAELLSTVRGNVSMALSPDGRQVAWVEGDGADRELQVLDIASARTASFALGDVSDMLWSRDSRRLSLAQHTEDGNHRVLVIDPEEESREVLIDDLRSVWRYLRLTADLQTLYYDAMTAGVRHVYRLPLNQNADPETVAELPADVWSRMVSPDGRWIAYSPSGEEIWVGRLGDEPLQVEDLHLLSSAGGSDFAFTPDGEAVVYADGNRVWRHPLDRGEREEVPIRLELERPTPPPLLVRRVRVLDFAAGGFGPETSLFVERGRIKWIGSEGGRELPPETVTLDAGGRFAIPGLFDMHTHVADPEAFVAYGVTSVRKLGEGLRYANRLVDHSQTTNDPVPRYFVSGPHFNSRNLVLEDARSRVRRFKEAGAHFLKIRVPSSWRLQRAVADEARRQGIPVIGHGESVEEVTKSVTLGFRTLEHISVRHYDDLLGLMAKAGTRFVPTFMTRPGGEWLFRREPELLADDKVRAFFSESLIDRLRGGDGRAIQSLSDDVSRGRWVDLFAATRRAHDLGMQLLTGTDASPSITLPGVSLHWELRFLVEAGLPPLEVLRIATEEAAVALGAQGDLGTLEIGKLADFVLLDRNPLEDIQNTQAIWRVTKGGWVFDPVELQRRK